MRPHVIVVVLGAAVGLMLLFAMLVALGTRRFEARVDREVQSLFANAKTSTAVIERAEIDALPKPVARWLTRAGVEGKPRAQTTRLRQAGQMRTDPKGAWLPVRAHQYFSFDPPAFVWRVRVKMMKVLPIEGRDAYIDGRGHMLITLGGLIPIVDGRGAQIDQGTLIRYLGELVWSPAAVFAPYIAWEPIDDAHARATMSFEDRSASVIFEFDDDGRQISMSARRYMGSGEDAVLADWQVRSVAWKRFGGIEVPSKGEVLWKLPAGDFSYFDWEITDLEFDPPGPFAD